MENLWLSLKAYLKNFFRDKSLVFYSLFLPLILGVMYYVATSSIVTPEIEISKVGLTTEETLIPYQDIFEEIEPFELVEMDENEAQEALKSDEIIGYINENRELVLANNGTYQSILKGILNEIEQVSSLGIDAQSVNFERDYIHQIEIPATFISIMFYGLVGMASLYGAYRGVEISEEVMAPMSPLAARLNVTPMKRYSYVLLNYLIAVVVSFSAGVLLLIFFEWVLDFDFITDYPYSLLLILGMNTFGISVGMVCGLLPNLSSKAKDNITLVFTLGLPMLAGGMSPNIPQVIYQVAPWLMKVNPVSTFTENFYRINLLNDYSKIQSGLLYIYCLTAILTGYVIYNLRGRKYDSI